MSKKYELNKHDVVVFEGRKLHAIKALRDILNEHGKCLVKKGESGGYVERDDNLSHEGSCWIYNIAKVCGDATVRDHAKVTDHAIISNNAVVRSNAIVSDDSCVYDDGVVCDDAVICNGGIVSGSAVVSGTSLISGDILITGDSIIAGKTNLIKEDNTPYHVFDEHIVHDNVFTKNEDDYLKVLIKI